MATENSFKESNPRMRSIFRSLALVPTSDPMHRFGIREIQREAEQTGDFDFVSFPTPRDVLVSRWCPGYRVTDLTGVSADEALALTLGAAMETVDDLQNFQRILATPDIAADAILKLLPRAGVPVKSRSYVMTEQMVADVVRTSVLARVQDASDAVIMAYVHAVTRVLSAKGLVAPGVEARVVNEAKSYTITADALRLVIMVEAMRGVFSESRIQSVVRYLEVDATPLVFGEQLGNMFRDFSRSIPEIQLRLKQFETIVQVVHAMNVNPLDVPEELRAHPSLIALMSIANFVLYAADNPLRNATMPGDAIEEIRRASDAILTTIQSAPSIESVPISKFAEMFGEVPIASPDGLRRGLVIYAASGQTSKMEVADVWPRKGGFAMSALDNSYVRASGISSPVTGSLLSIDAVKGLANIVADEAAMTPLNDEGFVTPELLSISVNATDVVYLAMARASTIAYIRQAADVNEERGLPLLFGCQVAEQWRMEVLAATPTTAYFTDPAAVVVYTSKMVPRDPKPMPARPQTIGLQMSRDVAYIGQNVEAMLVRLVGDTFTFRISVQPYGKDPIPLEMKINVLDGLVGTSSKPIDRGTAFYAAIREPGVDPEIDALLRLALAYARTGGNDINADKAKSWLVVHLAPIMMHPAVRLIAERAINQAVIAQNLDARSLRPQMREVYSRAFFGVALALLNRFGKLDGGIAVELTNVIPTSSLSLQAALTLAQLPSAINGSR